MIRSLFLSCVALGLTACVSLVPPARTLPPRYTLTAAPAGQSEFKLPITLAISDARAEGAINTSRIAVRTGPNEIRYLPDGEWSDRTPRIFSVLVERSIEERAELLAVSDRVALPLADYILYTDIQHFEADRTSDPAVARVVFRARLETQSKQVLSSRRFEATAPISEISTRASAAALNAAAASATSDLAQWTLSTIERAES